MIARHALTLRLSPAAGAGDELRAHLGARRALASRPGLVGAHLLRHHTPAIAPTKEQAIRGHADRNADWVFVACGSSAPRWRRSPRLIPLPIGSAPAVRSRIAVRGLFCWPARPRPACEQDRGAQVSLTSTW